MKYKKPTPEEIQIVADDHFFRKELLKEMQEFKDKLRDALESLIKDK